MNVNVSHHISIYIGSGTALGTSSGSGEASLKNLKIACDAESAINLL